MHNVKILKNSGLPCFKNSKTLNITKGCLHGCIYCYANHGNKSVSLDPEIVSKLSLELDRMKKQPKTIYCSTTCDIFQPREDILEISYRCLKLILEKNISIAILTKGFIPDKFIKLFSQYKNKVSIDIGITTLDEEIQKIIEPSASSPRERLNNIERLISIGIIPTVRMDPLIYNLTDAHIETMFSILSKYIKKCTVSYLFVRSCFIKYLKIFDLSKYKQLLGLAGTNSAMMVLPSEIRKIKFEEMISLGEKYGMRVEICGCKNSDISECNNCHIGGLEDIEDL